MANPLTGDFDVVLQVSGTTINRLLATMHQNGGAATELPTFPHSVAMRLGDPNPIDGMRGSAWAQLSVPRIHLIHGSNDRFELEVGIRARYKEDPGTTRVPEFIHGTIRAEYRLQEIDPDCWGWGRKAADYLWIRVVKSTISFEGTAVDDTDPLSVVQPVDPVVAKQRITRLARHLLVRRFQATPQKVERRFRRGSMRSLNAGGDQSAIAVSLAGQGQLSSINQYFLGGRDFGVAISASFIIATIQRNLDALKASFNSVLHMRLVVHADLWIFGGVDVLTVNVSWRVTLRSAAAQWAGGSLPLIGGSAGLVTINIYAEGRTSDRRFNMDFELTQLVMVTFNAVTEEFVPTLLGSPSVNPIGLAAPLIGSGERQQIAAFIQPTIEEEAKKLVGSLSVKNRKTDLTNQLAKLDRIPGAHFDEAEFSPHGVAVRGHITLSPRPPAARHFQPAEEGNGFTAFESWIPGGRIDSFEWSWRWFSSVKGAPGGDAIIDRFVLTRPRGVKRTKFGLVIDLTKPLPVLDGFGTMCLTIKGVQVHPVSGALLPVTSTRQCVRGGFDIRLHAAAEGGRIFVRDWVRRDRDKPVREVSLLDVGAARTDSVSNTLVVRVGDKWKEKIGRALRDGLAASRRVDAGLQILLLFADGTLADDDDLLDEVAEDTANLEAALLVNEDVKNSWSAALAIDPDEHELEWRLLTPTGGVSWGHRGELEAENLGRALDDYLYPAPPASVRPVAPRLTPGTRVTPGMLDAGLHEFEWEDTCPPPVGPFTIDARAVFVQPGSSASEAILERLEEELEEYEEDNDDDDDENGKRRRPFVVLIVDGVTPEELERLRDRFPDEFVAIPDPQGTIANRFGIQSWPTSVKVIDGVVTSVDVGAERSRDGSDSE